MTRAESAIKVCLGGLKLYIKKLFRSKKPLLSLFNVSRSRKATGGRRLFEF